MPLFFIIVLFSCRQKNPHEELVKGVDTVRTSSVVNQDTVLKVYTHWACVDAFKELLDGRKDTLEPGINETVITYLKGGTSVMTATIRTPGIIYVVDGDTFKTRFRYHVGDYWMR